MWWWWHHLSSNSCYIHPSTVFIPRTISYFILYFIFQKIDGILNFVSAFLFIHSFIYLASESSACSDGQILVCAVFGALTKTASPKWRTFSSYPCRMIHHHDKSCSKCRFRICVAGQNAAQRYCTGNPVFVVLAQRSLH